MKNIYRKKPPITRSASYKRWKKQLNALHKGDVATIKRLAREATVEREMRGEQVYA